MFATVALAGTGPRSKASVLEQFDGYLGALRAVPVGVPGVDTGG